VSRIVIVGDIHGCLAEWLDLVDKIGVNPEDHVISVGDLVDRGPDSPAVVDWFRSRPNTTVLCGNHERKHVKQTLSVSQEIVRMQYAERYTEACDYMGTLPYYVELPTVRVVHAATIPGMPLSEVPEDVLCGSTSGERKLKERYPEGWWHDHYEDDIPIVFGHHVTGEQPLVVRDRVFGLDTGACHGLRLTALVLPEFQLVSVPARGDHWRSTLKTWQMPLLRSRPWGEWTFEQIRRKVGELRRHHEQAPEVEAYLQGALDWSDAARASLPILCQSIDTIIASLLAEHGPENFGRAAAQHPASTHLLRRHQGRLSDQLACDGPGAVLALADKLGVTLDLARSPS
jgi:serine/threonine protein phosphatase 1